MLVGCGVSSNGAGPVADGGAGGQNGSDGGTIACAPAVIGAGVMGWLDDGSIQCADVVVLTHVVGSTNDVLDVVGATSRPVTVDMAITAEGSRLGGSYACGGDGGAASAVFVYGGGGNAFTVQSCAITITQPGSATANAHGTFSASLQTAAGLPKMITSGTFDGPLATPGG